MRAPLAGPLARVRWRDRLWLVLGGVNGAVAMAILASVSHGMADETTRLAEIGARFELFHAVLLVALSAVARHWTTRFIDIAASLFVLGCVLFSGGLYLDAFVHGAGGLLVPFGGSSFIVGWICLALAGLTGRGGGLV